MKAATLEKMQQQQHQGRNISGANHIHRRQCSMDDLDAVPPSCPPLRGEGLYAPLPPPQQQLQQQHLQQQHLQQQEPVYVTKGQLEPIYGTRGPQDPVYVTRDQLLRRGNNPATAPRPPQRTVSFLAGDTLPRKVAQVSQVQQPAAGNQVVCSESDLYGRLQQQVAAGDHNRSNSSPAPLPLQQQHHLQQQQQQQHQAKQNLSVSVDDEEPLPPPPYISPPSARHGGGGPALCSPEVPDDLPMPPPPPLGHLGPPSGPPHPPVATALLPRPPCDSASSSSSVDSGYARSNKPESPGYQLPVNRKLINYLSMPLINYQSICRPPSPSTT